MSTKLKHIKIVTYGNFPFGGSVANLLRNFAFSLSTTFNVEVVLPTGNYFGNKIDSNSKRKGQIKNVTYKHLCFINHPKGLFGKLVDNLCGFILPFFYCIKESVKRRLDLIILYDTTFTNVFVFLLIKLLLNKKLIIFIPDYYEKPKCSLRTIIPLINWYNFYFGLHYLVRYADSYIVVSHFLKDYLSKTLAIKKPIQVLPSLLNIDDFEVVDSVPYKANCITIGYTGTPTYRDGVVDLIKSFGELCKRHTNLQLLIIGDVVGGESVIPPLRTLAKEIGVEEKITFTGLVSFKEIPRLICSCQILALTRPAGVFAEAGFPTKLGEYFAARKPVVITQVGDIPKYFTPDKHIIMVRPNDIESIVNGFEKLIKDEGLINTLSENAYIWMLENLFYKNVSGKICSFINDTSLI